MRGFTLIELLAVIVILAIILLIAMPIISNVLDNVKRGAFESSMKLIIGSANNQYLADAVANDATTKYYAFDNNAQTGSDTLSFKGGVPKEGYINVRPDGKTEVALTDGTYCATKLYTEDKLNFKKLADGELCEVGGAIASACTFNNSGPIVTVVPGGYTPIYTIADLVNINLNLSGNYILMNSIDLASFGNWTPIGNFATAQVFTGILDGNGFSIDNLSINTAANNLGLFSGVSTGEVKNLGFKNVNITSPANSSIGSIAGDGGNDFTITNVYATGNINGDYNIGGLVGSSTSLSITKSCANLTINAENGYTGSLAGYVDQNMTVDNSYSIGNITGGGFVGGLVGEVDNGNLTITNSYNEGTITSPYGYVGGLVAANCDLIIENSYNIGNINGGSYTGGLGGQVCASHVSNSFSTGDITSNDGDTVGGLFGELDKSSINSHVSSGVYMDIYFDGNITVTSSFAIQVGGIAGLSMELTSVTNAYSKGTMTLSNPGNSSLIGGLFGGFYNSTISNSYSTINVSGKDCIGGIVGDTAESAINNVYAVSNVSGIKYVGGIAGYIGRGSTLTNSYSKGSISGNDFVGGIAGVGANDIVRPNNIISNSIALTTNMTRTSGALVTFGRVAGNSALTNLTLTNNYANVDLIDPFTLAFNKKTLTEKDGSDVIASPNQAFFNGLGWDFTTIWKTDALKNNGLPYFIWQD